MALTATPNDEFPWVRPMSRMGRPAVSRIAAHAKNIHLAPLNPNHVRFFLQPWGYVAWGVDLDLATGTVTRYPGNHEKRDVCSRAAEPEVHATLKLWLNSESFRMLPAETTKSGRDGASYFIELHIDGIYSWKCHWVPDDQAFLEVIELFQALSRDVFPHVKPTMVMASEAIPWIAWYAKDERMTPLKPNHVRLFLQSLGFVDWAVEIDLATGKITPNPMAQLMSGAPPAVASTEKLMKLNSLLRFDSFKGFPEEGPEFGDDGCSYFIEVDIDGIYSWKCHWSPNNQTFLEIVSMLESLSRDAEANDLLAGEAKYRASLTTTPGSWINHAGLGRFLKCQGRFAEAIEQFEQALRLDSKSGHSHAALAGAFLQQGKAPEAIELCTQALRFRPKFPEAIYNLGCALEQVGRAREAEEHYELALRMETYRIKGHIKTGNNLLRQGKPQKAIAYYQVALRIKPYYAQVHFNLGRAMEQVGRMQEAMEQYEQALICRPDLVRARNALTRLDAAH